MAISSVEFKTEKIFIGNVPPSASRTELQRHFSKYGKIVDCVMMTNKDGSGRGFGFCEFEEASSVDLVLDNWNNHFICGQWVEVKKASPENALRRYRGLNGSASHSYTSTTSTSSGVGNSKSVLCQGKYNGSAVALRGFIVQPFS